MFLLSPSLDLINIISVQALEAMKVASETLQRSQCTLLAARSYLQPCTVALDIKPQLIVKLFSVLN